MKKLIIAEKPSVALDISKALGDCTKHDDYYENNDFVISSAVGHLLEVICPEEFEVKRGKWSLNHLPVIPSHFDVRPIVKTESRLKVLLKLLKRKDVVGVINACDAGREGELIFRLIIQYAGSKKPIERLWLQSMTKTAILTGFKNLKSDAEMQALADAARSRSEADWLVGINGTRAMTAFNSKEGGFFLTTVGRVQTPTLCLMVDRDQQIKNFQPQTFWEIFADFSQQAQQYRGRWFDPDFKQESKEIKDDDIKEAKDKDLKSWRIFNIQQLAFLNLFLNHAQENQLPIEVQEQTKPSQQGPALLYDLTSLQREANQKFGLSAKNTLSIAQSLYEKHKMITYPRTDSKHLPKDYYKTTADTLKVLAQSDYSHLIEEALKGHAVAQNQKRIFDDSKVSDHFAIIPTLEKPKALSELEYKIYDLIARRFIAAFYPNAQYLITTRTSIVNDVQALHIPDIQTLKKESQEQGLALNFSSKQYFKTEGKILLEAGWLAVYQRAGKNNEEEDDKIPPLITNPITHTIEVALEDYQNLEQQTKPPAHFNESSLLSAMETAGKQIHDEDLREALIGKGLGTPATRATIIEGLISEKYILREGKELHATTKAEQLIRLLRGLSIDVLTKPELTGEWEHKLKQIEHKQLTRADFMAGIQEMTQLLVKAAKDFNQQTIPGDYIALQTPCPDCGGVVQESYRRFQCQSCNFSFTKTPAGRMFEGFEAEALLQHKIIGPLAGFRSKQGRPFSSILKLQTTQEEGDLRPSTKLCFDFGQDQNTQEIDFTGCVALGSCPKCGGLVFAQPQRYLCEHATKTPEHDKTCDFSVSMMILQQNIDQKTIEQLLNHKRSDLLTGFKSARTNRLFKAFLVVNEVGKIGFEFETKKTAEGKTSAKKSTKPAAKEPIKNSIKTSKSKAVKLTKPSKESEDKKDAEKAAKPKKPPKVQKAIKSQKSSNPTKESIK